MMAHAPDVWNDLLQELYFRRTLAGPTDWQWSYDTIIWYNTDDLAQVGWCCMLKFSGGSRQQGPWASGCATARPVHLPVHEGVTAVVACQLRTPV